MIFEWGPFLQCPVLLVILMLKSRPMKENQRVTVIPRAQSTLLQVPIPRRLEYLTVLGV